MTNAITVFLEERKKSREKKPEKRTQEDIDEEFNLLNWVKSAAKRAKQLTIVSHPGKFGHPDVSISAVSADATRSNDGYLRTGNVPNVPRDVFGNAAALDVHAFLSVLLNDGQTVLHHIRENTASIRDILNVDDETFHKIQDGLLAIERDEEPLRSDGKVKQVYFPISISDDANKYHLLSILTPSGLLFVHRERIRNSKFSDEAKAARDARRRNEHSDNGYVDFLNLLTVHYGGSQPQNVSRLNSSNSGEAYLMPSLPPILADGFLRLPRHDFFAELRWDDELKALINSVHRIFVVDYNNVNIRGAREYWLNRIFDWVFERAMAYQAMPAGWSQKATVALPLSQKLWLDPDNYDPQTLSDEQRDEIIASTIRWILSTYRKMTKNRAGAPMGDVEESRFRAELDDYAQDQVGGLL